MGAKEKKKDTNLQSRPRDRVIGSIRDRGGVVRSDKDVVGEYLSE